MRALATSADQYAEEGTEDLASLSLTSHVASPWAKGREYKISQEIQLVGRWTNDRGGTEERWKRTKLTIRAWFSNADDSRCWNFPAETITNHSRERETERERILYDKGCTEQDERADVFQVNL